MLNKYILIELIHFKKININQNLRGKEKGCNDLWLWVYSDALSYTEGIVENKERYFDI